MITNKKQLAAMLAALRGESRRMTSTEFKGALVALGLTRTAAAATLGASRRVVGCWSSGTYPVPLPVQWCLEFMVSERIN